MRNTCVVNQHNNQRQPPVETVTGKSGAGQPCLALPERPATKLLRIAIKHLRGNFAAAQKNPQGIDFSLADFVGRTQQQRAGMIGMDEQKFVACTRQ